MAPDVDDMTLAAIEVVLAAIGVLPAAPTGDASSGCIVYPYSVGGPRISVAIRNWLEEGYLVALRDQASTKIVGHNL